MQLFGWHSQARDSFVPKESKMTIDEIIAEDERLAAKAENDVLVYANLMGYRSINFPKLVERIRELEAELEINVRCRSCGG